MPGRTQDEQARRDLTRALAQFRAEPRKTLGVAAGAGADDVRRAFRELAKRYHPARFAQRDAGVVRLANEVFLAMRDAQQKVLQELAANPPSAASQTPPAPAGRQSGFGGAATPRARTAPVAAEPAPAPARPARPVLVPPAPSTPSPPPPTARRAALGPPAGPTPAPAAAPAPPSAARPVLVPPAPTATTPAARQAGREGHPRAATPPAGTPIVPEAERPRRSRPSTVPVPGKEPLLPPHEVKAAGDAAQLARQRFDRALDAIRRQQWRDARDELETLAAQAPADPRFRAYLHYVHGWEAFQLGRDGEARSEWLKALAADPGLGMARWALESTGLQR